MKRPNRWIVALVIVLIAGGAYWYSANHLSKDEIAQTVTSTLQKKLDSGDLAEYHMKVQKVDVLHEGGNKYKALVTVDLDGKPHDVPLSVVVDGTKVAWETEQGAFLFAAQERIQKSMQQFQAQMAQAASAAQEAAVRIDQQAAMPDNVRMLTAEWEGFNDQCRGGPGDDASTQAACDKREAVYPKIRSAGWCWGHRDDSGAERTWVQCRPGDI